MTLKGAEISSVLNITFGIHVDLLSIITIHLTLDELNEWQGERAREENLRERIVAESRIKSVLQGRILTPPLQ